MDYTASYYKKLCEDLQKRIEQLSEAGFGKPGQPPPSPKYRPGDRRLDPRTRKREDKDKFKDRGFDAKMRSGMASINQNKDARDLLRSMEPNLPTSAIPDNNLPLRKISTASQSNIGSLGQTDSLGKYSKNYRF